MKNFLFAIAILYSLNVQAQNFIWGRSYTGNNNSYGKSITSDQAGNIYNSGNFRMTIDFDPGPQTFTLSNPDFFTDNIYITKTNSNGTLLWAKKIGTSGNHCAVNSVYHYNSAIYLIGQFSGSCDFDPGPAVSTLTTGSMFVCKLDTAGNFMWVKSFNGSGPSRALAITGDNSQNIYITGSFVGTTDFDPSASNVFLTPLGYDDVFIAKLDTAGTFKWVKQFGGGRGTPIKWDAGTAIAADASNNIYVSGYFGDTCDVDPGPAVNLFITDAYPDTDIFVSKFDQNGSLIWAKQFGGNDQEAALAITLDNSSNIYFTGSFGSSNADFDPGPGTYTLAMTGINPDAFVCKLNNQGNLLWAKQLEGTFFSTSGNSGTSIKTDSQNNIYTAGIFTGIGDFDPGPLAYTLSTKANGYAPFVSKLDDSGNFISAITLQGKYPNPCEAIHLVANDIYLTGSYTDTIDFDPGPAVNTAVSLYSSAYLLKFSNLITGLNSYHVDEKTIISPNPTSGRLKIQKDIDKIKVYDCAGKMLIDCVQMSNELDISSFPSGIYFIEFSNDRNIYREKIIKN